jgi:hypothetical protein
MPRSSLAAERFRSGRLTRYGWELGGVELVEPGNQDVARDFYALVRGILDREPSQFGSTGPWEHRNRCKRSPNCFQIFRLSIIHHDNDPLQERFQQLMKVRELLAGVFALW